MGVVVLRAVVLGLFVLVLGGLSPALGKVITSEITFDFNELAPGMKCIEQDSCCSPSGGGHSIYVHTNTANNKIGHYRQWGNGTIVYAGSYPQLGHGSSHHDLLPSTIAIQDNLLFVLNANDPSITVNVINPHTHGLSVLDVIELSWDVGRAIGITVGKVGEDKYFVVGATETGYLFFMTLHIPHTSHNVELLEYSFAFWGHLTNLRLVGSCEEPSGYQALFFGSELCAMDMAHLCSGQTLSLEMYCLGLDTPFNSASLLSSSANPHFHLVTSTHQNELLLNSLYLSDHDFFFHTLGASTGVESLDGRSDVIFNQNLNVGYSVGGIKSIVAVALDIVNGGTSQLGTFETTKNPIGFPSHVTSSKDGSWVYALNSAIGTFAAFTSHNSGHHLQFQQEINVEGRFHTSTAGLLVY